MKYQLHFSNKRKTIALQIKQGDLVVRAPAYLTKQQVEQFVLSKQAWVTKKLAILEQQKPATFSYQDGDSLFVFGKARRFTVLMGDAQNVCLLEDSLVVTLTASQSSLTNKALLLKTLILDWFRQQVDTYLQEKLFFYQNVTGLCATSIKIRIYKSRWGSCNSKRALTFNTLLAMVPKAVFDYVIVHELCHIKHMNHSAAFWQLVASYIPDYRQQKHWLKINQKQLSLPEL